MNDWQLWVEAANGVVALTTAAITLVHALVTRRKDRGEERDGAED